MYVSALKDTRFRSVINFLDVPWQSLRIVLEMLSVPDIEHNIQLLKSEIFGLWQQEVAIYPAEYVPGCSTISQYLRGFEPFHAFGHAPRSIIAECAGTGESAFKRWPCERKDKIEA